MSNLALTMRPEKLAEVLGNENTKKALQSFIDKDSFPNVFLFSGPPGCGKTTLAEIVARAVAGEDGSIHEINGSDKNGVEDARELAETAGSCPFNGRRRVFIINEFHRWTDSAQDALKDPMEKTPAVWIITTDRPEKVQPAIKSRAAAATFCLKTLTQGQLSSLISDVFLRESIDTEKDEPSLTEFLWKHGVTSPREILGVLDQYLAGVPMEEAIHGSEHEPLYSEVAGAVLRGDWQKASTALQQIKTADSRGLIAITSAFFRSELIKTAAGPKAAALSACLVGMDQTGFADGTAYGAVCGLLYKCCAALGVK
jgi:DNA polymerase III subunit gamma/tau